MLKPSALIFVLGLLSQRGGLPGTPFPPASKSGVQKSRYEGLKHAFLDSNQDGGSRAYYLREMVMEDAQRALAMMPVALVDEDPVVRAEAAEWLAICGDSRGLDLKMKCIRDPDCVQRFRDIDRVGNSGRSEYAPAIAKFVGETLNRSWKGDHWSDQEDKLLAHGCIVALAKLGRPEDHQLILRIATSDTSFRSFGALGYVNDPRSRTVLWTNLEKMSARERASGGHIQPLLALSRLRDPNAIAQIKKILLGKGSQSDRWLPNQFPELSPERANAFAGLRGRDASNFAETVFTVAAQEPEGPGTREAWNALGIMHPQGYAERLLALALSRKLIWNTVPRDVQLRVILADDPNPAFVERFYSSYVDVQEIPDESHTIKLVRAGLGNLLFQGSWYWFGE